MGKIYTVVFNSAIDASGTSTNNKTFYFDWTQLEEGRYMVIWSFMSATPGTAPTASSVPNIFIDLGQGAYTSIASSGTVNQGQVYNSNFIGSLEFKSFTTAALSYGYYSATSTTNPPLYLDNRPRNNNVNILIFANGATQTTPFTPAPGAYTLTMQFHRQPDEDRNGGITYKRF